MGEPFKFGILEDCTGQNNNTEKHEPEILEKLSLEKLPLPIQELLRGMSAELRRVRIDNLVVDDITFTDEMLERLKDDAIGLRTEFNFSTIHFIMQRRLLEIMFPNADLECYGFDSVEEAPGRLDNLKKMNPKSQFLNLLSHRPSIYEAVTVWQINAHQPQTNK